LTDIGTEELGHMEMWAPSSNSSRATFDGRNQALGVRRLFRRHTSGIYPLSAAASPFRGGFPSKGDPITDLAEDMAPSKSPHDIRQHPAVLDTRMCATRSFFAGARNRTFPAVRESLRSSNDQLNAKKFYALTPRSTAAKSKRREGRKTRARPVTGALSRAFSAREREGPQRRSIGGWAKETRAVRRTALVIPQRSRIGARAAPKRMTAADAASSRAASSSRAARRSSGLGRAPRKNPGGRLARERRPAAARWSCARRASDGRDGAARPDTALARLRAARGV
jgi:hypothetical protein